MPDLVLLHGFLGSADDWQPLIEALPGVRCHALDLPGHGQTGGPPLRRLTDFPAWLQAELKRRQLRHYHLLGYSLGGRLALLHASQSPPGLLSLTLENSHPGLSSELERKTRARLDAHWVHRLRREPLPQVLADWYRQPVFIDLTEAERATLIALRSRNHPRALARMLAATSLARQPDLRPWLRQTALPLAYVSGQMDRKFAAIACQLAADCPTLTHISLVNAGHNVHRATPQALAARWHAWLASLPTA